MGLGKPNRSSWSYKDNRKYIFKLFCNFQFKWKWRFGSLCCCSHYFSWFLFHFYWALSWCLWCLEDGQHFSVFGLMVSSEQHDLMYEVYIKDQENLRFIFIVFLELNIKCKLLTKIHSDSIVFGFGTFSLEVAETITHLLIKLKVPFECE